MLQHLGRTEPTELRLEQRRLRTLGAGQEADPQASVIRRLVGSLMPDPDLATVRAAVVGMLAVLIEGMSAFGLYLAGIHIQRTHPALDTASIVLDAKVEPDRSVAAEVEGEIVSNTTVIGEERQQALLPPEAPTMSATRWAVERLDFVAGGSVLLADYRVCAAAAGITPLSDREFRQALIGAVLDLELEIHGQVLRGVALPRLHVEQMP